MKKTITFLSLCLFTQIGFAQIVFIPDPIFKARLISQGVDTSNDGEIQESEAESMTVLNVENPIGGTNFIEDLTGIEAFINLENLDCANNQLTNLDLSSLVNLEVLHADRNDLTSINLNGLLQLEVLWIQNNNLEIINLDSLENLWWLYCSNNSFATLDLNNLQSLTALWSESNLISEIDFSGNPLISEVYLSNNQLSNLDISNLEDLAEIHASFNNIETIQLNGANNLQRLFLSFNLLNEIDCSEIPLGYMESSDNPNLVSINVQNGAFENPDPDLLYFPLALNNTPNLTSICIDPEDNPALEVSDYDPSNVTVFTGPDCSLFLNENKLTTFSIYPNPVNDKIHITNNELANQFAVYDISGKYLVATNNYELLQDKMVNVSQGIYFLRITTFEGDVDTIKFVKR